MAPFDLDEDATNAETMEFFFGESIASFEPLPDGFFTSTDRRIEMTVDVNYPEFAPLMEWRTIGQPIKRWPRLGQQATVYFEDAGMHMVAVGPPERSAHLVIETYEVSITSHQSGYDTVGDGETVTFEAVTNPPGFEQNIRWLSSTKYGMAIPVRGDGPTFTVQFADIWGREPDGSLFQWLGVKADNAIFNQDQKPGACCTDVGECQDQMTAADCDKVGGVPQGAGSTCATIEHGCNYKCIYDPQEPGNCLPGGVCSPLASCDLAAGTAKQRWVNDCDPDLIDCPNETRKYQCVPSADVGCCCEQVFKAKETNPCRIPRGLNKVMDASASCCQTELSLICPDSLKIPAGTDPAVTEGTCTVCVGTPAAPGDALFFKTVPPSPLGEPCCSNCKIEITATDTNGMELHNPPEIKPGPLPPDFGDHHKL